MVIHTKEKAKIHTHNPKQAKIKGSNIYTVEREPKTTKASVKKAKATGAKNRKANVTEAKKSYRKSTIHQAGAKDKGLSRFKQNIRESNASIKTKQRNLHIAGRTGALAAGAVTEQVEGGQEVSQAAYFAYEASRPVTGTASKGAALFRKKAAAEAKKRIKKVEAGKKLAKKTAKKAAKDTAKTVAKETAKETAKTTAKVATKTATKTAATAAPIVGLVLLLLVLVVAMIAVPVIAAIAILYNSPFALFLDSYIAGLQRAGIQSFEIKANKTDDRTFEGVRIATMHRVKGLEFDYVFAVAVNKKVLPFGTRADFEDDISLEEFRTGEKCLLYVALTRARKSACVTCYGGLSELIVQDYLFITFKIGDWKGDM